MRGEKKMESQLDARGLSCPEPVVRTKRALEALAEGTLTVVVDCTTARDNVIRFAEGLGCRCRIAEERDGDIYIELQKKAL